MSRKVLVTGVTGQDGSYLAEFLLGRGYEVHGLIRRAGHPNTQNIDSIKSRLILHYGDLETEHHLCSLMHELKPDEVYNLAGQSDVGLSFNIPEYTGNITGLGVTRLLEAVRVFSPHSKVYQASTSELFGSAQPPQNECTPMLPNSPYAIAKLYAHNMCRNYRDAYGMFISCGILYNHESPRRGLNFVTRKIAKAAVDIKKGKQKYLSLGNLQARRDWGYSPEYVEAMHLMLQHSKPEDYVVGTGEAHTVGEFAEEAFKLVGLDWREYVVVDAEQFRPVETSFLCADSRKIYLDLGWKARIRFKELVEIMVNSELEASSK